MNQAQFGFAQSVGYGDISPVVSQYWRNVSAKHVYALFPNNAYGQNLSPLVQSWARAAGAEYDAAFADPAGTDFRGMLTRVREGNPDQLLIALQGSSTEGAVIKQARELGITAPMLEPGNNYQSKV